MNTPRTDRAKRSIEGFADEWVPRYVSEELELERKQFAVLNAELFDALEKLHNAVEDDDGDLNLALVRSRKLIDATRGELPQLREIIMHTDAVNRPVLDMAGVKTTPGEKILFRETSY